MVAMGRALMSQPKLLLLDEPSAGLSPIYVGQVFAQVRRINASGGGILMVEQNARPALAFATRGFVVVGGENRLSDTGPALLANPEVGRAFLGGGSTGAGVNEVDRKSTRLKSSHVAL